MFFNKKAAFVIAEVGINHDGSISKAKKLISAASKSGADAVKFQIYKTEKIMSANYKIKHDKNYSPKKQFNLLKKNELTFSQFRILKKFCDKIKIEFLATPFDNESADFLAEINVRIIKVSSGDFNNFLFIDHLIKKRKHMIFSTGRMSLSEIKKTMNFLKKRNFKNYSILHCVSAYPTNPNEINLNTIKFLKKKFKRNVGFSDHTQGITASVAAYMLGANIIEKHITLDTKGSGPDHKSSLEPDEFKAMVDSINFIKVAIGRDSKQVSKSELKTKEKSQRSLYARKLIKKGEKIKLKDLISLRPAVGIKSFDFEKVINKKAKKEINQNHVLKWSLLKK